MKTAASRHAGLLRRLVLLLFSVVPSAVSFGPSAWPLLVTWVVLGGVRVWCDDRKVLQDCLFFGALTGLILRNKISEAIFMRRDVLARNTESLVISGVAAIIVLVAFGYIFGNNDEEQKAHPAHLPEGARPWTMDHPKSFLIPCRTTHTRIFPKKHGFGYNYLLCGFPIVPAGTTLEEMDLPGRKDVFLGTWWLHIRAEDYLTRGQGSLGFYGKLQVYLREKGVKDSEWSYAYLVTAPRFFGYSFNPASFWYIYDRNHRLTRMITEVNNTFGERHLYLLDGSSPTSPPETPDEEVQVSPPSKTTFADYWTKEFHVSPFNSRKGGGYSQKSLNPFPTPMSSPAIDITITLRSSKDHPKIVARLFSIATASEFDALSWFGILKFIVTWGWVGFMTFPRILKEAFVLYFRRGLRVWFRPEVLGTSIGRLPSEAECFLQKVFGDYLSHLVQLSTDPFCINYETAIPDEPKLVVETENRRGPEWDVKNLELRVSSGAFYSRFVHYVHTREALDRECLFTDEKNRTLWISQPTLLPLLLPETMVAKLKTDEHVSKRSYLEELRWTFLQKLRCPPPEPAYPISPKSLEFDLDDIREHSFSEMDRFVRAPTGVLYAGYYRRTVTKLFLAQRYALGFTEMIDFMDLCLRLAVNWFGAWMVVRHAQGSRDSHDTTAYLTWLTVSASLCLCHVYGLSKGYK